MISVFKKQPPIQSSGPHGPGDGSETAPWNWYDIAEGENITDGTILRRDSSGAFVRVNLTAGVSYEIFADNSAHDSYIMVFYEDDNGNMSNAKDDDEDPGWDCDYENDSCEYSVRFTFTPEITGNYIIKYIEYYAQWDGSDNICGFDSAYIKPAPNVVQTSNPDEPPSLIYPTSEGFNSLGRPIVYRNTASAGLSTGIPNKGLIFYAPLSYNTTEAATGQQLTTTGSVQYKTINDINCAEFSGDGQFICSSDAGFPTGTSNRTVSAFVRRFSADHDTTIVSYGVNETNKRYSIGFTSSGGIESWGNSNTVSFDTTVPANTWVHVAVTFSNGVEALYLNGSLSKEVEHNNINTTLSEACIGACATNHIDKFVGNIAAVRVYNRILSEQEIKSLSKEFNI